MVMYNPFPSSTCVCCSNLCLSGRTAAGALAGNQELAGRDLNDDAHRGRRYHSVSRGRHRVASRVRWHPTYVLGRSYPRHPLASSIACIASAHREPAALRLTLPRRVPLEVGTQHHRLARRGR